MLANYNTLRPFQIKLTLKICFTTNIRYVVELFFLLLECFNTSNTDNLILTQIYVLQLLYNFTFGMLQYTELKEICQYINIWELNAKSNFDFRMLWYKFAWLNCSAALNFLFPNNVSTDELPLTDRVQCNGRVTLIPYNIYKCREYWQSGFAQKWAMYVSCDSDNEQYLKIK